MNDLQARELMNQAIAQMTDPEQVARAEMVREYFTNPTFRQAMTEEVAIRVEAINR